MAVPARFLSGVSTARSTTPFGNYPKPQPNYSCYYENDFTNYVAGDWTVTTSTGSTALTNTIPGGAVILTTAATLNDIQGNILNSQPFIFNTGQGYNGYEMWFSARVRMSDATNSLVMVGLQSGGTIQAPTDGVYFTKGTGATTWTLSIEKASSTTVINLPSTANAVAATDQIFSFYYDGRASGTLYYWVGTKTANFLNTDNSTFQVIGATQTLTNLPIVQLAPAMSIKAGAAAAKTLTVDYLIAAGDINR